MTHVASAPQEQQQPVLDPLYNYAQFLLWRRPACGRPSHNKLERLESLAAVRLFPAVSSTWLDPAEQYEVKMAGAGDTGAVLAELEDDDFFDSCPLPPLATPSWLVCERCNAEKGLISASMDKLTDS